MAVANKSRNGMPELLSRSDDYRELVTEVIWDCQVIEAGLRRYVTNSYEYIRRTVGRSLPYHLDQRDVEKDSMGALIAKFENLSDDPGLISKLKNLVKYRNKCAHRGFALTAKEWRSADFLTAELTK